MTTDRYTLRDNNPEAVEAHIMARDAVGRWHRVAGITANGVPRALCGHWWPRFTISRDTVRRGLIDPQGLETCDSCEQLLDTVLAEAERRADAAEQLDHVTDQRDRLITALADCTRALALHGDELVELRDQVDTLHELAEAQRTELEAQRQVLDTWGPVLVTLTRERDAALARVAELARRNREAAAVVDEAVAGE